MFDLLQHPPRSPEQARLGATISIVAHAAVVLTMVTGAGSASMPKVEFSESIIETTLRYLLPPDRTGAPSSEPQARWSSSTKGAESFTAPGVEGTPAPMNTGAQAAENADGSVAVPLEEAAAAQHAFTLADVDSAVARDPESAVPAYPAALQAQGIEGVAVVRFLVDTTGRAVLASYQLIETNHPLFGAAVREALPGMKFRPATIGTLKVRQLVELPFAFKIIRRGEALSAAKKP